jgi:hypothetical protein
MPSALGLVAGRSESSIFKVARARRPRALGVRFRWTAEIFSARGRPSALRVSWSSIFKVARGEEARSLIACHVSLLMDG